MEINGVAHIQLTVSSFAAARAFYGELLPFLGLTPVMDFDGFYYCVGARTGLSRSRRRTSAYRAERFAAAARRAPSRLLSRARERADVDAVHAFALKLGATIVHAPEEASWAPGYYSVLFEDPDGIRIEVNHVPGKGLLPAQGDG